MFSDRLRLYLFVQIIDSCSQSQRNVILENYVNFYKLLGQHALKLPFPARLLPILPPAWNILENSGHERLLLCLQWSIWLIFFNSLIVLWARLILFQNRQMALLRFVCVPCIVYLNAIVSNYFNLSHMDITELPWCWPRVSHFPKLLHLFNCIRKEYVCVVIVKNIL